MPMLYEILQTNDYWRGTDCFCLANLNQILPLGKPLRILKSTNTDVFLVKDEQELFGPLRTGSVSPLEYSTLKVKEKIKGNLVDAQILLVDHSLKSMNHSASFQLPMVVEDTYFGGNRSFEVNIQATFAINYHVTDSKALAEAVVKRKLLSASGSVEAFAKRILAQELGAVYHLNGSLHELISKGLTKVQNAIKQQLRYFSLPYINIDYCDCQLICTNQQDIINGLNKMEDDARGRRIYLQDTFIEMMREAMNRPVLSDAIGQFLVQYAVNNPGVDSDSMLKVVDKIYQLERANGSDRVWAAFEKVAPTILGGSALLNIPYNNNPINGSLISKNLPGVI